MHAAIITAAIYNTAANRKKGSRMVKPEDCMPRWDQSRSEEEVVEGWQTLGDEAD